MLRRDVPDGSPIPSEGPQSRGVSAAEETLAAPIPSGVITRRKLLASQDRYPGHREARSASQRTQRDRPQGGLRHNDSELRRVYRGRSDADLGLSVAIGGFCDADRGISVAIGGRCDAIQGLCDANLGLSAAMEGLCGADRGTSDANLGMRYGIRGFRDADLGPSVAKAGRGGSPLKFCVADPPREGSEPGGRGSQLGAEIRDRRLRCL
jgi:hypothetical protein